MSDFFGLFLSLLCVAWGLLGVALGSTSLSIRTRIFSSFTLFTYQGRGLGIVILIMGVLLLIIYILSHITPPRITTERATFFTALVLMIGFVVALVMSVVNVITRGASPKSPSSKANRLTLRQAASFLNMPESELLQMAQNGGIRAFKVNGQYMFDAEILHAFRESLRRIKA
ncbi:MAG: helix-turn-helix domain-containing protein [Anaerolineae bacterium]|nr:helix-turn-helix domain-containing protein [Anaerolineae bacterium]